MPPGDPSCAKCDSTSSRPTFGVSSEPNPSSHYYQPNPSQRRSDPTRNQPGRSEAVSHRESASVDDDPPPQQPATATVHRGPFPPVEARSQELPPSLPPLFARAQSLHIEGKSAGGFAVSDPPSQSFSARTQTPNPRLFPPNGQPKPGTSSPSGFAGVTINQGGSLPVDDPTNADHSDSQPPDHNLSSSVQQGWSHSIDPSLRCATLHLASRLPASTEQVILFVGVNLKQGQDAEDDLEFMKRLFTEPRPGNVHFEGLSGGDATPNKIRETICELYRTAQDLAHRPKLVIFFTGQGDEESRMCLLDDQTIGAEDVMGWLCLLHAESPRILPVTIIFDYCREAEAKTSPNMHPDVALIMSCSPGQRAYALQLSSQPNIPRSVFLNGLLMTSYDSSSGQSVEVVLERHMDQVVAFLKHSHHIRHAEECADCQKGPPCPEVGLQNPDLEQAGGSLVELAGLFSRNCSQIARNVYQAFMNNNIFRAVNNIEFTTNSESSYAPLPPNRTTQHYRGAKGTQGSVQAS